MNTQPAGSSGAAPSPERIPERRTTLKSKTSDGLWGYFLSSPDDRLDRFSLVPLISAFVISMMNWDGMGAKKFIGLQNFVSQLQDEEFHIALVNTVYYTILSVPTGIVLAMLVAVGLNRVRGKILYRLIYFMPNITMSVAVAVVFMWLFNADFGLINMYLQQWFGITGPSWLTDSRYVMPSIALLSVWMGLGGNMVLFHAGLQGISRSYYEAAEIDGAGKWQQLIHITIPLLSPTTFS